MKKIIVYSLLLSFSLTSCMGQDKTDNSNSEKDTIEPKISSNVHKEYDEDGNLISIDSTYSYFYSNIKNDSILEQKFFKDFQMGFDDNLRNLNSIFRRDFFTDTPFNLNDFYTDDFYENRFNLQQKSIQDIFKRMDSIKNSYYSDRNEALKKQM